MHISHIKLSYWGCDPWWFAPQLRGGSIYKRKVIQQKADIQTVWFQGDHH
jgi:hypothetical protein